MSEQPAPDPTLTAGLGGAPADTLPLPSPLCEVAGPAADASLSGQNDPGAPSFSPPSVPHLGRYLLQREIGRGGMGMVYAAWDPELGREVALKVLGSGALASAVDRERFLREARAAARLEHPHLVRVYDLGEQGGTAFFTMPLVVGPTLSDVLRKGPVPPRQAASWASAVARALHHAHRAGFVHRDVKPGNILLEGGERPLLTDFGLVRQVVADEAPLTVDLQVLGTPAYMSPEQARGSTKAVGPLSDQYALGVVLYEMLAGARPFPERNPGDVLRRILEEDPPTLTGRGLPAPLVAICGMAMARAATDRYPDTGALADDLDRFLRGEPVVAALPSLPAQARQALRRQWNTVRRGAWMIGAAALGLGIYAAGSSWLRLREGAARERAAEERRALLRDSVSALVSAGEMAKADALFDAFARFEGNAETTALARAWRDWGDVLAARGEQEGALDAWSTGFAIARDPIEQRSALEALGTGYRASSNWEGLRAVDHTLRKLGVDPSTTRPERGWARDLALIEGDLAGASALTDDPAELALLGRLAQQTRTQHSAEQAFLWDVDRDGRSEILLSKADDPEVVLTDTSSPELPTRAVLTGLTPAPYRDLFPLETAPPASPIALVGQHDAPVVALRGERLDEVARLDLHGPIAVSVDLDGDGLAEHYAAGFNALFRLDPDGKGGFQEVPVHGGSNHSNTQIWALTAGDLDGDGRQELVAGTGPWGGYDLRVFHAEPGGNLSLVTRRHLGDVTQTKLVRTAGGLAIAAFQDHDSSTGHSNQIFRRGGPHGEARGLHVLHLTAQGLVETAVMPWREREVLPTAAEVHQAVDDFRRIYTGDLSGDGLDEIVFGSGSGWLDIYLQHPDGQFSALELSGVLPLAMAQVDADPEQELLVATVDTDHPLWVLGAGDDHLVQAPSALAAPPPPPDDLGPELALAWERAEALVNIGRMRSAAARFQTLANLATAPGVRARARLRAAEILEAHGDPGAAGPLYEAVAAEPALAVRAWEGALRCFQADMRPELALAAAHARLALPSPPVGLGATAASLRQQTVAESILFDFRQGIDPRWRVKSPTGVRLDRAAGGLRLSASAGADLLDLPVTWAGQPFEIAVSMTLQRLDWGASLGFSLVPPDAEGVADGGARFYRIGGGGVLAEAFICPSVLNGFAVWDRPGALVGRPLGMSWAVDFPGRRGACSLQGSDGEDGRRVYHVGIMPIAPGPALLRISGSSELSGIAHALLAELTLTGLQLRELPSDPDLDANRALALGQPADALARVSERSDSGALLVRALALDAEERRADAALALRTALARDPSLGGELHRLVQTELKRFEGPLRAALGPRYFRTLWEASGAFFSMHEGETPADAALIEHLGGLETLPLSAYRSEEDAGALLTLLVRRAAAWRRAGQPGAALRDLARVEAVAAALGEPKARGGEFAWLLSRTLASAGRERALVALGQGDPSGAMDALLEGLRKSAAPEVFADTLVSNPELDPLHGQKRWAEVLAARRVWP